MSNIPVAGVTPVVINWHITEACNFGCKYCYAEWQRPERHDLICDPGASAALMEALYAHFQPMRSGVRPRLNFAGGEPLLFPKQLTGAMREARRLGFDVSLITNASRLMSPLLEEIVPLLSLLGVSFDSARPETLAAIGRRDARGRQLDVDSLAQTFRQARQINPALSVKVNTVVCEANWEEDMSNAIEALNPDRWKLLRMLPAINRRLEVTNAQFQYFVARHQAFTAIADVEDNDDMAGSYIMIDPAGRFFQNRTGAIGYNYSPPILEVGVADAHAQVGWSELKFDRRYQKAPEGSLA